MSQVRNRKQSSKIMLCETLDAVQKVFGDPELEPPVSPVVEKLLPYLDATSTLRLIQSGITCILKLLQGTSVVWTKLVQRTLPDDDKIGVDQMYHHEYNNRVRELFEERQVQMVPKVPVFKCQKVALGAPTSKNGLQKPRETPPKMVG